MNESLYQSVEIEAVIDGATTSSDDLDSSAEISNSTSKIAVINTFANDIWTFIFTIMVVIGAFGNATVLWIVAGKMNLDSQINQIIN